MSTSELPLTVVDSHVHWWDPANPWMVMATQEQADELAMGDISAMKRAYLPAEYRADTADRPIAKVVWVMATMDARGHLDEVAWVRRIASGDDLLGGVIGSVDPRLSGAEQRSSLEAQLEWDKFRGVRVIGELDYGSGAADDYMRMLADHGLVFDHMGHHPTMKEAGRLAERHPDVPWVLEHCGWPQHPSDPSDVAAWKSGITYLSQVPTVSCKLSGLAMATHSFDLEGQRPFLEHCLEQFGPDRCMFGSNFPVDGNYGTFGDLMTMFLALTAGLSDAERDGVLHANAERVYRL